MLHDMDSLTAKVSQHIIGRRPVNGSVGTFDCTPLQAGCCVHPLINTVRGNKEEDTIGYESHIKPTFDSEEIEKYILSA